MESSFLKRRRETFKATDAIALKILISHTAFFPPMGYWLSANGAVFIASLGQTPQDAWFKKIQALKARPTEPRFQRFMYSMLRIPGALPQAHLRRAPLALEGLRSLALFPR